MLSSGVGIFYRAFSARGTNAKVKVDFPTSETIIGLQKSGFVPHF